MRKQIIRVGAILLLIVILFTIISRGLHTFSLANITLTKARKYTISHSIEKQGRVEQNNEFIVLTSSGQIVSSIYVKEGDVVEKGQALFAIDLEFLQEQIVKNQKEMQLLDLQMQDANNQIHKAQETDSLEKEHANQSYTQVVNNWNKKIDNLLTDYQHAKAEYEYYRDNGFNKQEDGETDSQEENKGTNTNEGLDHEQEYLAELARLEDEMNNRQQQYQEAVLQRENDILAAKQNVETMGMTSAPATTVQQLQLQREQIELSYNKLVELQTGEGKVLAPEKGVITSILIGIGQPTTDSAAILIADEASGEKIELRLEDSEEKYVDKRCKLIINGRDMDNNEVEYTEAKISSIRQADGPPILDGSMESDAKKTYKAIIQINGNIFPIGTIVMIEIVNDLLSYNTCIPIKALHQEGADKYFVYIVSKKNSMLGEEAIAKKLYVNLKDKDLEYAAIEDDILSSEQKIILSSDKILQDGSSVRLKVE